MTRAFTLIELSIVLIIIGLLVGGVLVGRDLIESAEFQSQVSQIRNYDTAVRTFELKYDCLPGDCDNGSAFGVQTDDGDGDGKVLPNTACAAGVYDDEAGMFWQGLSGAGLIEFRPVANNDEMPYPVLDNSVLLGASYSYPLGSHVWTIGAEWSSVDGPQVMEEGLSGGSQLTSERLARLDRMMDDGSPYTGKVLLAPNSGNWCYSLPDLSQTQDDYLVGGDRTADTDCVASGDGTFDPSGGIAYSFDTDNADCPFFVLW